MTTSTNPSKWLRRTIQGGLASGLAIVGLVAFATPAFAHNNLVSAVDSCASPLGTGYVVTWTIANDWNEPETGSVTSVTDGSSPLSLSTLNSSTYSIAATPGSTDSTTTLTQTLPAGTALGNLTLNIDSTWTPDNYNTTDSGTISLASLNCAAPVQTIAGHIYLCNDSNPTTTEESGGSLSATGPQTVSSSPNPLAPTDVNAGGYTMTATAPSGYLLVACGGTSTPSGSGTSATEPVTVPSGGAGVGVFYVTPITPAITSGGGGTAANPDPVPPVTPSAVTPTPVTPSAAAPAASTLAFTGASLATELKWAGILVLLGLGLVTASRRWLRKIGGNR